MEINFVPKNLKKAKEKIVALHSYSNKIDKVIASPTLEVLIKNIVGWDKEKVDLYSNSLSAQDILYVANYIPRNYYKVTLDNLWQVFMHCSSLDSCQYFYESWQNEFDSRECNEYIANIVLEQNASFKELLGKNHLEIEWFKKIISEKVNIPVEFGLHIQSLLNLKYKSFQEKMNYFGIVQGTRLYSTCESLFYTYCEKQDYLAVNEDVLQRIIQKYDLQCTKLFLRNFLIKLDVQELYKYRQLAKYLMGITGDVKTASFKEFFNDFEEKLVIKYRNWINNYKIRKFFGNDVRSEFWDKYVYVDVHEFSYYKKKNEVRLMMEFENYYGIEFLDKDNEDKNDMGPLYFFEKDYFEKYVLRMMKNNAYTNSEVKSFLYNKTEWSKNQNSINPGHRWLHQGDWQAYVRYTIKTNDITQLDQ